MLVICMFPVFMNSLYHTVKNLGSKKLWRIRTVGSLAVKLWQIEVPLHRECYGNSENWQRKLDKML